MDYRYRNDFLVQDADIFFESIKKANPGMLADEFHVVSAEPLRYGVVRCKITDGKTERTIDIEVIQKTEGDGTKRYEYKVLQIE